MRFEELSDDAIRTIAQALLRCDDRRSLRDAVARGEAVLALAATCRAVHRALRQGVLDEARLYAHARIWPQRDGAGMIATQAADERRSQRLLAFVEDAHAVGAFRSAGRDARPNRRDFNSAERKCEVVSRRATFGAYIPVHVSAGTDDVVVTVEEAPDEDDPDVIEVWNTTRIETALVARRRSASGAFEMCGAPIPDAGYENLVACPGIRMCVIQGTDQLDKLGESYDVFDVNDLAALGATKTSFVSVYEWSGDAFQLVERHRLVVGPKRDIHNVFLNARNEPCVLMGYRGSLVTLHNLCSTEPVVNWLGVDPSQRARDRMANVAENDWFAVHNFTTGRSSTPWLGSSHALDVSASDDAATLVVTTRDGVVLFSGPDYDEVPPRELLYERAPLSNHLPVFGSREHAEVQELQRTGSAAPTVSELSPNGQFLFLQSDNGLCVLLASGEHGDFARGRAYSLTTYRGLKLVLNVVAFTRCSRYCVFKANLHGALLCVDLHRMLATHDRRVPERAIRSLGPLPAPEAFTPPHLHLGANMVLGFPVGDQRGLLALTRRAPEGAAHGPRADRALDPSA